MTETVPALGSSPSGEATVYSNQEEGPATGGGRRGNRASPGQTSHDCSEDEANCQLRGRIKGQQGFRLVFPSSGPRETTIKIFL